MHKRNRLAARKGKQIASTTHVNWLMVNIRQQCKINRINNSRRPSSFDPDT